MSKKKETATKPVNFFVVKFVRINKSIKLIEGGETNIDEICFKVGFNSHSYYSMCFRKQLGQTPSDYISRIKRESKGVN